MTQPAIPAWKLWTGRVLTVLPVLVLLMSASMKLSHSPQVVEGFGKYGFAEGLLLPIGIVEILCVVIYLVPPTAVLGAILITGYLGGAMVTHIRAGEPFFIPFLVAVMAWGGIWLREPRLQVLAPLRK